MKRLKIIATHIASSHKTFTALFIFAIVAFVIKSLSFLDPDFGWHLRMGEYIKNVGIPKTDPFSYTMPSFPFIDHEWLTNVVINVLYKSGGYISLAMIFAVIGVGAIFLSLMNPLSRNTPSKYFVKYSFLFVLGVGTVIPFVGIRPQIISWLYLSVLILVLFNQTIWNRFRFLMPLFFLLWVNTHGSFGAGLMIFLFVLLLRTIRTRRITGSDLLVILLSCSTTFLTPYGYGNWREFLQQGGDISIHWTIAEWKPSVFDFNITFIILGCLSFFLLWKYRKKYVLEEHGLFILLFSQALSALRHVPLWTIMALPIISVGLEYLYEDVKSIKYGKERLAILYTVSFWLFFPIVLIAAYIRINDSTDLSEANYYPQKAVSYIKTHLPQDNIFTEYVWGGYFDWYVPEKKVFIDGRMATWKWDANPPEEDGYIFDVYQKLHTGEVDYKEVFSKYSISTVLLPKQVEEDEKVFFPKLQNYINRITGYTNDFNLVKELQKDGWQTVYEDDVAVVYQKPME